MTDNPAVSVIISSFNTRALLETCLRSVMQDAMKSRLRAEVIVVDDASTDGSGEMVATLFPMVKLLQFPTNQGYAKANNAGIRAARAPVLLLLNADTEVRPGTIVALLHALERHPKVAVVGPKLLNSDETIQRSCWRFPLRSLVGNSVFLFRLGVWDDYRTWDHSADKRVDWTSSAAWMVRRSTLDEVGLFDEQFWVYGVDVDWAMRARRRGYGFLSLADAEVVHIGKSSWGSALTRMSVDHARWHHVLMRKHYGRIGVAAYRGVVLMNAMVRVLFWGGMLALGNKRVGPKVTQFRNEVRWAWFGPKQLPQDAHAPLGTVRDH